MKNAQLKKSSSLSSKKILQPPARRPIGKTRPPKLVQKGNVLVPESRKKANPQTIKKGPPSPPSKGKIARARGSDSKALGAKQGKPGPLVASKTVVLVDEKAHAKHGPSSLHNKEICCGFVGTGTESNASAEGSLLHKYMEDWGRAYVKAHGKPFYASDAADISKRFEELTLEQRGVIESLQAVMAPLFDEYIQGEILFEYEFDLTMLNLPGCEHGTADVVLVNISQDHFCVVDYKFGKNEVAAPEDNVQFHAYTLGGFHKYPKSNTADVKCLQPRCDSFGYATFERKQMREMSLRLKVIVERAEIGDKLTLTGSIQMPDWWWAIGLDAPKLNPQASLCEYCANVGICPAVAKFALKNVPGPLVDSDLGGLDPASHASNSNALGMLASWAKIMEAASKNLLSRLVILSGEGHEIDGFFLVNSSGKKSLIDPVGLSKELQKQFKLTPDQIISCAQIGTEKLEELVVKSAKEGTKEKAKDDIRKLLSSGGYFKAGDGFSYLKKYAAK